MREYRIKNRDRLNAYAREYRAKNRARIFEIYGKECACGIKNTQFLTLAHKNDDGAQDRRENGGFGGVCLRATKRPDPTRYETQCYNCQRIGWYNHLANKTYVNNSEKAIKRRELQHKRFNRWRLRVFQEYGYSCACCGESDQRVLELGHKNNDGAQDRHEHGGSWAVIRRAVEYPDYCKYEILCANCNEGAAHNGGVCPHKLDGLKLITPRIEQGSLQRG